MRYLLVILGAAIYGTDVQANQQQGDTWSLTTAVNSRHDNNIFRLNDETSLPSGLYRSDDIGSGSLQGRWGTRWSRQQLFASANIERQEYRRNSGMSHTGHGWRVGWQGVMGPWLRPSLSYGESRRLGAFEDVALGIKDMQDERRLEGELANPQERMLALSLAGSWRTLRHGSHLYQPLDLDESGWRATSGLRSRQGASLLLGWEHKQTDYLQQAGGGRDSDQDTLSLIGHWPVTARLSLDAELGRLGWRYAGDTRRHYWVGRLAARYEAGAHHQFDASWQRREAPSGERYQSVINDTARLGWIWQWSERLGLEQRLSQVRADYQPGVLAGGDLLGDETTLSYSAALNWRPSERWSTQLSWEWGRREASQDYREYDYQSAGLNLSYIY